jgi:quercetin dioxygenase-like cupin family protein
MTPDVVKAGGKGAKVLYENDMVRVLELKFRKGQKLAMHSHPPNFVYAVTAVKFKSISPDGKGEIVRMKKGESSWGEASTHAVENHAPGTILQIEFK